MADKQVWAKIGVFVLLGLNVTAYYIFWPTPNGPTRSEAKAPREEKGEVQLLPAAPTPVKPKAIPANAVDVATPLLIPPAPSLPKEDDVVEKLLSRIKQQTESVNGTILPPPNPLATEEKKDVFPNLPLLPESATPKPLPPLKADTLIPEPVNPNIGLTMGLTPKLAPRSWSLRTEAVGAQTLLVARLDHPGSDRQIAEFRILCDRVQGGAADGSVQAIGKVTFNGAGMKGVCQRLTLNMNERFLVFEEQVNIVNDLNTGSNLRGERVVWEPVVEANPPRLGAPKGLQ